MFISAVYFPFPQASTQRVTGPHVPMHRSASDPTSPGQLMDYEPMALTNTSSDNDSDDGDDDDDVYVNFASPRSGSGKYYCAHFMMAV